MPIEQNHTQNISDKVSFIITYYNLPVAMLLECIDSIIALSLRPQEREILVIDDGSEVSPVNELTKYKDAVVYLRQENRGLSEARNTGLRLATGVLVQFIDADDRLLRTPYEHVLDIARYEKPDVVMFRETSHQTSDVTFEEVGPLTGSEYMRKYNLRASACGYIFRKSILMSLHFTPTLLHEDEEFTPQLLLRAERVFDTTASAYYYRQRKSSIMHTKDKAWIEKRLNDLEHIILHLNIMAEDTFVADRQALKRRVAQLSMDYLYNTIRLTHSGKELDERIGRLSREGLFPLPENDYTRKYTVFRKMITSKVGKHLMLLGLR
jgi:glycosyltransferase involved in cell wall biosynthesis